MNQYRITPLNTKDDIGGAWKEFHMPDFQRDCAHWARHGIEFKVQFRSS
jgi:hypothetical protein